MSRYALAIFFEVLIEGATYYFTSPSRAVTHFWQYLIKPQLKKHAPGLYEKMVQQPETRLQSIERQTGQTVSIDTHFSHENIDKCNPQSESPLFQIIPEIRHLIFEFVTAEYPDPERLYDPDSFWYRPDTTGPPRQNTNFLLTCRRAWLEAGVLLMRQVEPKFWFWRGPGVFINPVQERNTLGYFMQARDDMPQVIRFLNATTTNNIRNLTHLRVFLQMWAAQRMGTSELQKYYLPKQMLARGLCPQVFQITIRQSDWWYWEDGNPPKLDSEWVQNVLDAPQLGGVKEFRLELEVPKFWEAQLKLIIERLTKLEGRFKLLDPLDEANCQTVVRFLHKHDDLQPSTWSRSPQVGKRLEPAYASLKTLDLVCFTITWAAYKFPRTAENFSGEADPTWQNILRSPFSSSSLQLDARRADLRSVQMRSPRRFPRPQVNFSLWGQQSGSSRSSLPPMTIDGRRHQMSDAEIERETRRRSQEVEKVKKRWEAQNSLLKLQA